MALQLKSDKSVVNNGEFQYITDYGIASKEVASYFHALKSEGYTLTETEYNALTTFESGLKQNGIWDSMIEFMPMFGDTIDTQLYKLIYLNENKAIALNSLDEDNLDDGKGIKWLSQQNSLARTANLKINPADILSGNGIGSVVYYETNPNQGTTSKRTFYGVSDTNTIGSNSVTLNITDAQGYLSDRTFNSQLNYNASFEGSNRVVTRNTWDVDKKTEVRSGYLNGSLVNDSTSEVQILPTNIQSKDIYLGCLNGASEAFSFYGSIRFFALHDGSFEASKVAVLDSLLEDFITDSGKTFV